MSSLQINFVALVDEASTRKLFGDVGGFWEAGSKGKV